MPYTLETDTITNQDIGASRVAVGTYTATKDGVVYVDLLLDGLNGSAAVITADITVTHSSTERQGPRWSDSKQAAGDLTFTRPLAFTVSVSSGDVIEVGVESSNSGDSSADGFVIFRDGLWTNGDSAIIEGEVDDATPAAGSFNGDDALSATDDFYNGSVLVFTSGTLTGIARQVTDYTASAETFTFGTAFPTAPADNDTFIIVGRIE